MSEEDFIRALKKGDLSRARDTLVLLEDELPRPRHLYLEGLLLEREGDHRGALKKYDMGLVMHLSDRSIWFAKARVLAHLGKMDLARRAVERGMRLSQNEPWAHVFYGDILLRMRDYAGAFKEAEKALEIDMDDPGALLLMGLILSIRDQDFKGALKHFERALMVDERNPEAWTNRGTVLRNMGDVNGARSSFLKALVIDPNNEMAKRSLDNLGEVDVVPSKVEDEISSALEVERNEDGTAPSGEPKGTADKLGDGPSDLSNEDEDDIWEDEERDTEGEEPSEELELVCPRCKERFDIQLRGRTRFRCPGCGLQGEVD